MLVAEPLWTEVAEPLPDTEACDERILETPDVSEFRAEVAEDESELNDTEALLGVEEIELEREELDFEREVEELERDVDEINEVLDVLLWEVEVFDEVVLVIG